MPAAATSVIFKRSLLLPPDVVAGELPRHAPAARAALERPEERGLARRVVRLAAEGLHPMVGDLEVLVLVEWVEREPKPEALPERDLLLPGLARVDLAAHVLRLQVLVHELRHQVAAIGGGVDQHVVGRSPDRAAQR